jgi:hypothetical protein
LAIITRTNAHHDKAVFFSTPEALFTACSLDKDPPFI